VWQWGTHDGISYFRYAHFLGVRFSALYNGPPLISRQFDSITLREGEARESWHAIDQHKVETIKKTPVAQWGFGASELIETTEKVVKVRRM
jgi:hypothetical protein